MSTSTARCATQALSPARIVALAAGSLALILALAPWQSAAATETDNSPWVLLSQLRDALQEAGPTSGRFVQTYIPAGFESGDQESGHLSIWLPDCLRWNYTDPQAKSFLVCEGQVYFWNEGETGGRNYKIDPSEEPGLDLLLVDVSTLRQRYVASSEKTSSGSYVISLAMPPSAEGSFSARIEIDSAKERVLALEYTDGEGNLTRFKISNYSRLSHTALFKPPSGMQWTEE